MGSRAKTRTWNLPVLIPAQVSRSADGCEGVSPPLPHPAAARSSVSLITPGIGVFAA
jgi:hypothetical protein